MAAYGQTQYSPALQPPGPYAPYAHHAQGYSMPSYSECKQIFLIPNTELDQSCVCKSAYRVVEFSIFILVLRLRSQLQICQEQQP